MKKGLKLRDYQQTDLLFHLKQKKSMNLSEPSTGKTPTADCFIEATSYLGQVAFIMPNSLVSQNLEKLKDWTNFKDEEIEVITGKTPAKREAAYANTKAKVFICSFSTFAKEWSKIPNLNSIVIDEFHMGYSTNDSKRTQGYYQAALKCEYLLILTGTLIDGRLSSAYPAIHTVEPRYYSSYGHFFNTHAVTDIWGGIIDWRGHDRITEILKRHSVRHTTAEVYAGAPQPIVIPEKCNIDPKHEAAYKEFEKNALLELEDKWLDDSGSGGVHQLRCRQILSCPDSIDLQIKGELGKDEMLKVHLEDAINTGKPLILFSIFNAEQNRILELCSDLKIKAAVMNGMTSAAKRAEIDTQFKAGDLQVIIGSPDVMSVGFDWEHVDTIVFVSVNYRDSSWIQGIRRADRGTRTYPLIVYRLYYPVAVEYRMWEIIQQKISNNQKVMLGV